MEKYIYFVFSLPDNLYCVVGDVKPCSISQSIPVLFYCLVRFGIILVELCSPKTQTYDMLFSALH